MGADGRRLRLTVGIINAVWGTWALIGGATFLTDHEALGRQTTFSVLGNTVYGYWAVGWILVLCGAASVIGACRPRIGKVAALTFAVCSAVVAMVVQVGSPTAQADVDTWLLLAYSFTCLMIWGLYELEPRLEH